MLVSYSQVLAKMKVVQRRNIHPYQRHCPHCDQILAYKTYKAHKRLYYNRASGAYPEIPIHYADIRMYY